MLVTGIDVGSRTVKTVTMDSVTRTVVDSRRGDTTFNPLEQIRRMLLGLRHRHLVATGYGRRLVLESFGGDAITEIQAHALGARRLFPQCTGVLDIGGQDTKAIALDLNGKVRKFEMNDRCAAGTGKFLEFMATSFQVLLQDFGGFAALGKEGVVLNSMCTVFAEAEATSLMARGCRPEDIARALHVSVVKRSLSMLKRVSTGGPLVFSGGVAKNACIVKLMRSEVGTGLIVPEEPDTVGALGAALSAIRILPA
jgi:(R)-2-hydroxyacyl-CoA dehydratese activating ATPase